MSVISGANAVAGAGGAAAYEIERSLRSNGTYAGGSDYMQRQNSGTSGNRKVWTLSLWMKICNITSNDEHIWMVSNTGVGGNPSAYVRLLLEGNVLKLGSNGSASEAFASTALLRDVSAWYHVVISCDNANTILRVYVNGVEWTTTNGFLASKTNPTNTDGVVNNASYYNHFCMFRTAEPRTFNGYLAEIHFVDGSALPASTFGEFNSETGVWQPIQVTGVTYGTQGYYLPLNDNASTTTLGYDGAGSNDFTLSGFSVTAGSGNDSLVDTPTPYGTDTGAGGEVRGNYCTFNSVFKNIGGAYSGTFTNGNLEFATSGNASHGLGTLSVASTSSTGYYFEITCGSLDTARTYIGLLNPDAAPIVEANAASYRWPYKAVLSNTGYYYNYASGTDGGNAGSYTTYTTNDIIMVAYKNGAIWFGKNGTWMNSGNPAAGTGYIDNGLETSINWFPYVGYNSSFTANFGQRPFAYTAPSGFAALCTTNLPDPSVVDGSTAMNAVLYTGNGATGQTITGVGFQPDLVWVKSRSNAYDNGLQDVLRGVTKDLNSNNTDAEETRASSITAFASDGFTLGGNDLIYNGSGATYVAWNWKAGGSGVSNTDGTITSTVSVNTTAGISIITHTGTGSNGTIGHGLGTPPHFVITKSRSNAESWTGWHKGLSGGTYNIELNTTNGEQNSPTHYTALPTSTVIRIGTNTATNSSGWTYVTYAFAPTPGFAAFGKLTGNGSADGVFVYTGFRPKWVVIKRIDASGYDWILQDTSRSPYNYADSVLMPDTSGTESNGGGYNLDILSNGFKLRNSGGQTNYSGWIYIYSAFAENPIKYALAR